MTEISIARTATFGGASARGASHIRRNKPNQDARGGWRCGQWTIIAVSDGHGGEPYFRSDRGSRFAVEAVREAFMALSAGGSAGAADRDHLGAEIAALPARIVACWRAAVTSDIRSDSDPRLMVADPHVAYGATCIAAAFGPGVSVFAQLGDGDLLAAAAGEDLTKPLPDDEGLEGEQTYSLCHLDAPAYFRTKSFVAPHPLAGPEFVMASSDGLSKSFAEDSQFFDVARRWRSLVAQNGVEATCGDLETWLARCSEMGSGDDNTLMFYSAAANAGAFAPMAQPTVVHGGAPMPLAPSVAATVRSGSGFGVLALAALLGAGIGAGAIYYFMKSRETVAAAPQVAGSPLPTVSSPEPLPTNSPSENAPPQPVELSVPAKGPSPRGIPVPAAPALPVPPLPAAEK
ncbi:MAG: protein phosphatase 2C domain-containing protein [Xanthobacteraceae bacterium]|nr:MAG: protein phosphatase 2C domain-containing protein [Xanthobacteraceae bacterium]